MRIATYQPRLIYPDIPQLGRDIYENGLTCFIDRFLEGYSGEIAFYQFGEIKTPGVSDIDLLIVVEDEEWKQSTQRARSIINSSGLLFYLFTHEPVVVCESLLPSLPFLHTFENCKHVHGTWDPLAQIPTEIQDESARLMRHVVWNSFMRVAALELDNNAVGLRRALSLVHNLLVAAHSGNEFLTQPVSVSLSTEEIRSKIASASPMEQESLVRTFISQVVEVLNTTDKLLDQELGCKIGFNPNSPPLIVATRRHFLVSPLTVTFSEAREDSWCERVLKNAQVVRVPTYLISLVAMLADRMGSQFSDLAPFRGLLRREPLFQGFDITLYAERFRAALRVFEMHGMAYFFPRPFSHREYKESPKNRIVRQIRYQALSRHLSREKWFGD